MLHAYGVSKITGAVLNSTTIRCRHASAVSIPNVGTPDRMRVQCDLFCGNDGCERPSYDQPDDLVSAKARRMGSERHDFGGCDVPSRRGCGTLYRFSACTCLLSMAVTAGYFGGWAMRPLSLPNRRQSGCNGVSGMRYAARTHGMMDLRFK